MTDRPSRSHRAGAPLVSCVICTHDYGAYVGAAIRSALEQEGMPAGGVEVIVVDDGSSDQTPEVLAGFGDAIAVLRQDHRGPAVGTARGIAAARGRYVAPLDADDAWLPDKLARQLELLERRPRVGLVHGDMLIVDGDGRLTHPSKFTRLVQPPVAGRALGAVLCANHVTTSSILLPTALARRLPPAPDWVWCRDWWIAAQVAAVHELDYVTDPVARYRVHDRSIGGSERDAERRLTIAQRDLRVRRLLLRTLDLRAATLDELGTALDRTAAVAAQVARARGAAPAEILPVDDGDRDAARRDVQAARAALGDDPAAAGRYAVRALAADGHDDAARTLFEEARARLAHAGPHADTTAAVAHLARSASPHTDAGADAAAAHPARNASPHANAGAAAPGPPRTGAATPAGQAADVDPDRLRELAARRAELVAGRPGEPPLGELVARLQRFEHLCGAIAAGGPAGTPLPEVTEADRDAAVTAVAEALAALDAGAHERAAVRLVAALALDPRDAHARALLERALAALGGAAPRPDDAAVRARFHASMGGPLDGARAFVAIAFADELAARPALLRTWAAQFGPDDDATLAIAVRGGDAAAAETQVVGALRAAGIPLDDGRDLALVPVGDGTAGLGALARRAHACCSDEPVSGPLGGLPRAGADDPAALREHAERRWPLGGLPRAGVDDPAALREHAERRWSHGGLGRALSIAIKICAPRWDGAESWGDLHYARALADAFERCGHRARIDVVTEWDAPEARACDVALHLRGLSPYVPHDGQLNVLWTISHPDLVTAAECDRYDLAFSASSRHAAALSERTRRPVAVLEQATDPGVFFPDPDPAHARELVLVGNSRGILRPIVRDLLPTDRDLAIWGSGWERLVDRRHLAGRYLPNDAVRHAYSSAAIVLNDHWDDMRAQGIVSNRITDALACGAVVVSDRLPELAERFGDAVATYGTRDELRAAVARLLADPGERAAISARGRALVLAQHTFDHRADTLLAAIAGALKFAATTADSRGR